MSIPSVKTLETAFPTKGKILRKLLGSLRDINGNTVGNYTFE
jgi:hypothetical protein